MNDDLHLVPCRLSDLGRGVTLLVSSSADEPLRPATRWERLKYAVLQPLFHTTRWFRPRVTVVRIGDDGCELTYERWSWLRWCWEQVS